MKRIISSTVKKTAVPPGTLVYTGNMVDKELEITIINYDKLNFSKKVVTEAEECFNCKESNIISWINIDRLNRLEIISKIGDYFDIHPLVLEDILNINQLTKMEEFEDYIFLVAKMLYYDEVSQEIVAEQVSFLLGKSSVITFQERKGDVFDPIRDRLKNSNGKIRNMGADYLLYALLDAIVDNYFIMLEKIGDKIEGLEEDLMENPTTETMHAIHKLKREILFLRKYIWPLREIINELQKTESNLLNESTSIYFRDVYDHIIQVINTVETFRDMVTGMIDLYLSSVSNKMNEVMKVLTIIATIFIPLTFIVGIYGMNFRNMPELEWKFGYPIIMLLMLFIGAIMIRYFKKKKWL
jgi:magnesium transporter